MNEDLPALSPQRQLRPLEALIGRALALFAMQWSLLILPELVKLWLEDNDLMIYVSPEERRLLDQEVYSSMEETVVTWSNESLIAFWWMLGILPELDFTWRAHDAVPEGMPNLVEGERADALRERMALRPAEEILAQLDLHYRLGWWTRGCWTRLEECDVNFQVIMERLRALDWAFSLEDWDDVDVRNRG